jgi:hypothetical protein
MAPPPASTIGLIRGCLRGDVDPAELGSMIMEAQRACGTS